ncbi:MAG: CobW family GTP-binding protein [Syntrophobacteraceae bacterium]
MHKTPVMLITGSLGSGKTTLVRRILDSSPPRIAVLMNEFGEIAIDSEVIRGENVDIVELAGGCVCCSMTGEFEAAIREIIEKAKPEFIVVEATGVAESDALVYEVEDNLPEVRLDSVVCLIDAYLSIRHPYVGYTSRTQIASADALLVNKIDLVTSDEAKAVEEQVRRYNDHAVVVRAIGCDVDTEALFGLNVGARPRPASIGGGGGFQSFSWESSNLLDAGRFEDLARGLPDEVFRAKGFVRSTDGGRLFNFVAGRTDFEPFATDATRLVFIGRELDAVRPQILEELRKCEVE